MLPRARAMTRKMTVTRTPPHRVYELLVCPGCGAQVGAVIHPHEGCERVNGLGVVITVAPLGSPPAVDAYTLPTNVNVPPDAPAIGGLTPSDSPPR